MDQQRQRVIKLLLPWALDLLSLTRASTQHSYIPLFIIYQQQHHHRSRSCCGSITQVMLIFFTLSAAQVANNANKFYYLAMIWEGSRSCSCGSQAFLSDFCTQRAVFSVRAACNLRLVEMQIGRAQASFSLFWCCRNEVTFQCV
jgi:hypothetical protein